MTKVLDKWQILSKMPIEYRIIDRGGMFTVQSNARNTDWIDCENGTYFHIHEAKRRRQQVMGHDTTQPFTVVEE